MAEETKESRLTPEQHKMLRLSGDSIDEVLEHRPELVQNILFDYRNGLYQGAIARKYAGHFESDDDKINERIVQKIIKESLSEDERTELELEHKSASSKDVGRANYEQGKGIFAMSDEDLLEARRTGGVNAKKTQSEQDIGIYGMTQEERSELGKKYGPKGGRATYERGAGVFAMSPEERSKASRKGGKKGGRKAFEEGKGMHAMTEEERKEAWRKSIEAQGMIPYDVTFSEATGHYEGDWIIILGGLERFKRRDGRRDIILITEFTNKFYNNGRPPAYVSSFMSRNRSRLR